MKRAAFSLLAFAVAVVPACNNGHPGDACPVSAELFQCHRAIVEVQTIAGTVCTNITIDDGQPCRAGSGLCSGGVCVKPSDTPSTCGGGVVAVDDSVCVADADCHGPNLCADYSCPSPGQDVCLILPKPDGTRCDNGLACLHGLCCLPVPDVACTMGTTGNPCPAIEDCTVGACGTDGVCQFSRSLPGDDCVTKVGDVGKCAQPDGDVVPRCFPLMPGK